MTQLRISTDRRCATERGVSRKPVCCCSPNQRDSWLGSCLARKPSCVSYPGNEGARNRDRTEVSAFVTNLLTCLLVALGAVPTVRLGSGLARMGGAKRGEAKGGSREEYVKLCETCGRGRRGVVKRCGPSARLLGRCWLGEARARKVQYIPWELRGNAGELDGSCGKLCHGAATGTGTGIVG